MKEIKETNHHICACCGNEYVLDKPFSHIIPKHFFRRLKRGICNKDAYSTYFKRLTHRQPKEFLLCHKCEQVFPIGKISLQQILRITFTKNHFQ